MLSATLKTLSKAAIVASSAMMLASAAYAAPLSSAPRMPQIVEGGIATPVHCRIYRHCHRRCWRVRGVRRCRRYCHFCG